MNILLSLVVVAQVLSAIGVIVLVLLQHGKGADMGAAFGSGASGSLFGATGSANFLSRLTAAMATVFFVSTLALSFLGSRQSTAPKSVMEQPPASAPATGVPGAGAPASGVPGAASSAPASGVPSAPAAGVPAVPAGSAPAAPVSGVPAPVPAAPAAGAASGSAPASAGDAAPQKSGQSTQIPK